jgi:hypothetical protein
MPRNKKVYMVGLSAICWALWRACNAVCFEKKKIGSPTEIICSAASYITYWAGLQKDETKAELEMGAEALKDAALLHHPRLTRQNKTHWRFLITPRHCMSKTREQGWCCCAEDREHHREKSAMLCKEKLGVLLQEI